MSNLSQAWHDQQNNRDPRGRYQHKLHAGADTSVDLEPGPAPARRARSFEVDLERLEEMVRLSSMVRRDTGMPAAAALAEIHEDFGDEVGDWPVDPSTARDLQQAPDAQSRMRVLERWGWSMGPAGSLETATAEGGGRKLLFHGIEIQEWEADEDAPRIEVDGNCVHLADRDPWVDVRKRWYSCDGGIVEATRNDQGSSRIVMTHTEPVRSAWWDDGSGNGEVVKFPTQPQVLGRATRSNGITRLEVRNDGGPAAVVTWPSSRDDWVAAGVRVHDGRLDVPGADVEQMPLPLPGQSFDDFDDFYDWHGPDHDDDDRFEDSFWDRHDRERDAWKIARAERLGWS